MVRIWIGVAAINGLIAVGAGAFGAHVLKTRLEPQAASMFETAARYQMYHALGLLGTAWLISACPSRALVAAAVCLVIGIVLFSGSLYVLSLAGWRWVGPITPIGGVSLMLGWLLLAGGVLRSSRPVPGDAG